MTADRLRAAALLPMAYDPLSHLAAAFDQHADVHDSSDCLHDPCAMAAAADEYVGDGA